MEKVAFDLGLQKLLGFLIAEMGGHSGVKEYFWQQDKGILLAVSPRQEMGHS